MQDDTYRIIVEALKLFRQLPELERRKIIDYLKARASEPSASFSPPGSDAETTL